MRARRLQNALQSLDAAIREVNSALAEMRKREFAAELGGRAR
jgi:hypothetical protein